ncbi:MAG TPA: type II secretion system protein [Pyrinomonadaceae bacterium]|jgi:prepilin-type N-terminal cleavage/methylation domain-containing protein
MRAPEAKLKKSDEGGFSLLELLIGMTILLVALGAASTLLSSSLTTRARENQKTDALADAQRAVNIMARDIANGGYGLVKDNGLVAADSSLNSIRVRANTHNDTGYDPVDPATNVQQLATDDQDEDLTYVFQPANGTIVRWDNNVAANRAALAGGISSLQITYLDSTGVGNVPPAQPTAAQVNNAVRVRLDVVINLPPVNNQPASLVRLTSDVTLRNAPNVVDQY